MSNSFLKKGAIAFLAAAGWAAIATQCYLGIQVFAAQGKPLIGAVVDVLSYFTILTNILVAAVLTWSLFESNKPDSEAYPSPATKTAVASYIAIVGCVYALILHKLWSPEGLHLAVDTTLHYIVPAGYTLYWLFGVPKGTVRYSSVAWWTIYPLAYLAYSMVRGHVYGFFPYPFVDFVKLGYAQFAANVALLVLAFAGTGVIFVTVDHVMGKGRSL